MKNEVKVLKLNTSKYIIRVFHLESHEAQIKAQSANIETKR